MAGRLETLSGALGKDKFKKRRQSIGLHCNPSPLVFGRSLRANCRNVSSCSLDWARVPLAGGGVYCEVGAGNLDRTLQSFA
eukprot:7365835-Pyramimonas_sp.AAC.1